jgi:hypothetical protein
MKNDATIGGTPVFGTNKVTFNGTTDYLQYKTGNNYVRGSLPWSIIMRCRPRIINGAVQVSCYLGEVVSGQGLLLGLNTVGNPYFQLYGVTAYAFAEIVDLTSVYEMVFTFPGGTNSIRCYLNGQYRAATAAVTPTITAPNMWVGAASAVPLYPFTGDVSLVKVFNQQLSDEEVAQHYNNSLYSYRNRATIYLPMRNNEHTATQTLDVSGNKRHATFGAAAACPTKLTNRHGYDFDGGDYMSTSLNGAFNTSEITLAAEFEADYAIDGTIRPLWDSTNPNRYLLNKDAADTLGLYCNGTLIGAAVGSASWLPYWYRTGRNIIVASCKNGKSNLWLNGVRIIIDAATAWAPGDPATLYIGTNAFVAAYHDGRITRFASWPIALTTTQIYDLMNHWKKLSSEA